MFLKGILAISGYTGLYKLISQGKSTIIVESLEDQKRMPAYASSKISALEDIAVFTDDKEVPLAIVFKSIFEKQNGEPVIFEKNSDENLKKYFVEILPDYDRKRVYNSDIKKIINWYNLLQKQNLIVIEDTEVVEKELKEELKEV